MNHHEYEKKVRRFTRLEFPGGIIEIGGQVFFKDHPTECVGENCSTCMERRQILEIKKTATFVRNNLWRFWRAVSQVGEATSLARTYIQDKYGRSIV